MRSKCNKEPNRLLLAADAVCVTALAALVAVWLGTGGGATPQGLAAGIVSAALFAVLGVRFLHLWAKDWAGMLPETRRPAIPEPIRPAVLARIFLVCLGAAFAALLLVYIVQLITGSRDSFRKALEVWRLLDSRHYLDIARDWYLPDGEEGRLMQLVFLPGYPLAVRLFASFMGDYLHAGLAVSGLCFGGAGVLLYMLARLDWGHEAALRALKYACILPGSLFFAAPMSESLFFLLSLGCVYLARREKWLPSCILGGLAAFTRSLGLTLVVPVCYELLSLTMARRPGQGDRAARLRRARDFACLLVIPLGFGAYCLVCRVVTGDAFRFMTYQREHWSQSPGLFFSTAGYQTDYLMKYRAAGELKKIMGLSLPNLFCTLGSLAVMGAAVRRLRPSYGAYFIVYYGVAVGTTWLLSGPRYLAAAFPVSMALASLTEDRRADDVLTLLLAVLYTLYDFAFVGRWQVW